MMQTPLSCSLCRTSTTGGTKCQRTRSRSREKSKTRRIRFRLAAGIAGDDSPFIATMATARAPVRSGRECAKGR